MSYIKGIDVLPQELIDLIQNYVDGENILQKFFLKCIITNNKMRHKAK